MIISKNLFTSVGRFVETLNIFANYFAHSFSLKSTVNYKYKSVIEKRTLVLFKDNDSGKLLCDTCMLCTKVCPSKCISIIPGVDSYAKEYLFDSSRCIYCESCVLVCPNEAIEFKKCKNMAKSNRGALVIDLCKLIKNK